MSQPLEYEQLSYNSPDGSQWGKSSQEPIAFYGSTPVAQRANATQRIITVSSAAGSILTFLSISQTPSEGGAGAGKTVTAGRVSATTFNFSFAPLTISSADVIIVNKQVPLDNAGIANARVSSANVTSASIAMPITLALVCGGDSGNISTASFSAGDSYAFAAIKGFVESVTLTPAAVAAQTTAEQQFTVTGLAVGMSVPIVKPTDQNNLGIVGTRVVSNNVLGITFLNGGNTALTPTSETYRYAGLLGVAAVSPLLVVGLNVSTGAATGAQKISTDGITSAVIQVSGVRSTDLFLGGAVKEHQQTVGGANTNVDQRFLKALSVRTSGACTVAIDFVNFNTQNAPIGHSASDVWVAQMYRQPNDAPMRQYQVPFTPTICPPFYVQEQAMTVTGITVSSVVHVSKPSFTTGIGIVGYRVSAANVIGVSFINATAVSVTPPTETYLVAHFQPLLGIGHWASQMVSPLAVQGVALTNEMQAVLSGTGLMAGS